MNDPLIGIFAGVQVNFSVADCLVAGLHPFGMFDDSADPAVLRILHSRGRSLLEYDDEVGAAADCLT